MYAQVCLQHRQELAMAETAHVQRESAVGLRWVEHERFAQRRVNSRRRLGDDPSKVVLPRRERNATLTADEQRVLEEKALARQAMAHG